MGVGNERLGFAEFHSGSRGECLFTVLVSVGDRDMGQELVAGACSPASASGRCGVSGVVPGTAQAHVGGNVRARS